LMTSHKCVGIPANKRHFTRRTDSKPLLIVVFDRPRILSLLLKLPKPGFQLTQSFRVLRILNKVDNFVRIRLQIIQLVAGTVDVGRHQPMTVLLLTASQDGLPGGRLVQI
jgi:hypothetical protein